MNPIYELPAALQGKQIVARTADLDISVKFGLWENFQQWLTKPQTEFWYSDQMLQDHTVELSVKLGADTIFTHRFQEFQSIHIHHSIDDETHQQLPLTLELSGLSSLPIRDDTGIFVSGMFEIQTVELQKISLINLLSDTMIGTDRTVQIDLATPVYPWMVQQRSKILPKSFILPNTSI